MWQRNAMTKWPSALPEGLAGTGPVGPEPRTGRVVGCAPPRFVDAVKRQYAAQGWTPQGCKTSSKTCRVVTVGHQLVVCSGPAFLHHKVLSAIRTARGLEARGACRSCPCFGWLLRTTIGKKLPCGWPWCTTIGIWMTSPAQPVGRLNT